VTRFRCW